MPVDMASFSTRLLGWYDTHARRLPWRAPPGAPLPDPYRVWLSEIMLQQTTVAAVAPYYARFLARWPTVAALAAASEAEVLHEWAGLGYYARGRNLSACARAVAADGFPTGEVALRRLPGVGRYTAAAIAAIAFGHRAVVVDGNVERVVARLFAVATPLPRAKPELYALADRLTPKARAGDFAQAMMDLGSTVCTPRRPRCDRCPVRDMCGAYASRQPTAFPVKAAKPERPTRQATAWWHERDGQIALERRPSGGLLGGMLGLPLSEGPARAPLGRITHIFTHFRLELDVSGAEPGCNPPPAAEWWPRDRLLDAGLPTVFRKAAVLALGRTNVRD